MNSVIYPGQKIKIGGGQASAPAPAPAAKPAPAAAPAPTASSGSYTVKSGDTLSAIAAKHGVKLSEILSANKLTMSSVIYPGNKLVIPGLINAHGHVADLSQLAP